MNFAIILFYFSTYIIVISILNSDTALLDAFDAKVSIDLGYWFAVIESPIFIYRFMHFRHLTAISIPKFFNNKSDFQIPTKTLNLDFSFMSTNWISVFALSVAWNCLEHCWTVKIWFTPIVSLKLDSEVLAGIIQNGWFVVAKSCFWNFWNEIFLIFKFLF